MLVVALTAGLLIGCGAGGGGQVAQTTAAEAARSHPESKQKLRKLRVTLDGWESPENVGILMAKQRGYFADVGLDPDILAPVFPWRPIKYVVEGLDEIGVSQEPQVVLARARGAPIVAVGSLISRPTDAMIWLPDSKISSIADLKGKTIAVPGIPYQKQLLRNLLASEGLTPHDVRIKRFGFGYDSVSALVSGRADALFGGSWSVDGAALEAKGLKPVITRVQSLGVPAYDQLEVIARSGQVSRHPRMIRAFMSAAARGMAAAIEDPEGAAEVIATAFESNSRGSPKEIEAEVEATVPLLSRSGYMNPDRARRLIDWMYEKEMIQRKVPVRELLTNEYLAQP
ncbi:MAG: ABC transporter substrate-binding protein [Solirubrobacterales bacterium]